MDIIIDTNVPQKKEIVPHGVQVRMERYCEAYKKVYGIPPEVTYDGEYIRIHGQAQGVTPTRLKEMTNQLNWRAG